MADNQTLYNGLSQTFVLSMHDTSGTGSGPFMPRNQINDSVNDILSASAANLHSYLTQNALLTSEPGQWSNSYVTTTVNTQATVSQASAGAGKRNVLNWFVCGLYNDATGSVQVPLAFNIRDGGTGAGTLLWSVYLSLAATASIASQPFMLNGLNVPGSAATAMTFETSGATAAHTVAWLAFGGCIAA